MKSRALIAPGRSWAVGESGGEGIDSPFVPRGQMRRARCTCCEPFGEHAEREADRRPQDHLDADRGQTELEQDVGWEAWVHDRARGVAQRLRRFARGYLRNGSKKKPANPAAAISSARTRGRGRGPTPLATSA